MYSIEEKEKIIESRFYTIPEVMVYMRIGRNKAYKLAHTPGVPVIKIGKTILFDKEDLNKWIENHYGKNIEAFINKKSIPTVCARTK